MTTFLVDSVKRDNGVIIGVSCYQENAMHNVRMYQELNHVYHGQFTGKLITYYVEYVVDKNTMEKGRFALKAEKSDGEYMIVEPEDENQREGLRSLPEYVFHPGDAL